MQLWPYTVNNSPIVDFQVCSIDSGLSLLSISLTYIQRKYYNDDNFRHIRCAAKLLDVLRLKARAAAAKGSK